MTALRISLLLSVLLAIAILVGMKRHATTQTYKIGWISALTGPVSKYAAHESALLAQEEINAAGGILGQPLELVMEDGKCEGAAAVSALKKLIEIDRVQFILGGHCSTETLAIAPIAQRAKVLLLASISSSPSITAMGDLIFRTSPIATGQSELIARYMQNLLQVSRPVILYEETAYAVPIAESLAREFSASSGHILLLSFNSAETDYRPLLLRAKKFAADALFVAVQAQDRALLLLRQMHELGLGTVLLGNEVFGNSVTLFPDEQKLFEGIVFAESEFDADNVRAQGFIKRYQARFNKEALPYGFWNADAYDGVMILAHAINRCGADVERVRDCLLALKNYAGASGLISFDQNGDAQRKFVLKQVQAGKIVTIHHALASTAPKQLLPQTNDSY